ncbi:MAG: pectate lyase [Pyrinomonadaceae bacterium]
MDQPVRWGDAVLHQPPEWYRSTAARTLADTVLQFQSPQGAWPKNTDLSVRPHSPAEMPAPDSEVANTIDNGATTLPMQFLARVIQADGDDKYRQSFNRGLAYLFAAQYPNGGWPQFYPLRAGYYSHITFNDDAMVNVLTLLRDIGAGRAPYSFVDRTRRSRARAAVAKGIEIILRTQIKQNGKLTAWCAQYDERTFEPAWARNYEPPSLSGEESAGIVRFLIEIDHPSRQIRAAIKGALEWFRAAAINGIRLEEFTGPDGRRDRRVVPDPTAPLLWARFYELGTNRPIFLGRDRVFRYAFSEIEYERRNGYSYYGTWPAALLTQDLTK